MDWSIDKAITFMNEDNAGFHKKTERRRLQLRQQLGDWSDHTQSWLAQTDIPVHLVRYEELRRDTAITLHGVLTFASLPAAEKDVNRAVKFSEFTRLRQQEERSGFAEAPTWNRGRKFFRRGEIGKLA